MRIYKTRSPVVGDRPVLRLFPEQPRLFPVATLYCERRQKGIVNGLVVLAFALLLVGIAGSVLPLVPGPLSSLAGVYVFWYATGYSRPGLFVLAVLTLVGLAGLVFEYAGGAVTAKAGGASTTTAMVATVVGIALALVSGPVGLVLGVLATVFAVEFWRQRDAAASARSAAYAVVGVLASSVVQVVLTTAMLVAVALVALA